MSLVKRNKVAFPSFLDEFFVPDWFGGTENFSGTLPAVNIIENEKDFELQLAVPGKNKEDFKVEIDHDVLTVSSEEMSNENIEESTYTRKEFSYKAFKRAFTLPKTVETSMIDAIYKDGILTLTVPKKEESLPKPKRLIKIV